MNELDKHIQKYQLLNKGLKKQHQNKQISTGKSFLFSSLPVLVMGAVAGELKAQCNSGIAANLNMPQNAVLSFDAGDGGANDFRIFESLGSAALKLSILNNDLSVLRVASHTDNSASALRVALNGSVTANHGGGNFVDENDPPLFLAYNGGGEFDIGNGGGYFIFKSSSTGNLGFVHLNIISGNLLSASGVNIDVNHAGMSDSTDPIVAGNCSSLLPVELIAFTASVLDKTNNVTLQWQTASEEDNAGFEVQRSTDGQRFETLTFIEGKGNSQAIQNYLYDDKALRQNQTYYYRLKQIDYSGEFSYSDIVAVKLAGKESILGNFYPNPSAGRVQMKYTAPQAEDLLLTVYTNTGQEVLSLKRHAEAGTSLLSFDVSSLQSGHYFVKLQNGDTTNYQELVIE